MLWVSRPNFPSFLCGNGHSHPPLTAVVEYPTMLVLLFADVTNPTLVLASFSTQSEMPNLGQLTFRCEGLVKIESCAIEQLTPSRRLNIRYSASFSV